MTKTGARPTCVVTERKNSRNITLKKKKIVFKILKVTYTYTLLFTFSCWKKKLGIPEQQNKGLFAHLCVPTFRLYVKVEKSFFVQFPSEKHFAGLFYTALCMLASSVQHSISISQCMTLY